MTIMKAITIWQPWASLVAIEAKPYEFRGWTPPRSLIGQRIAIHAGARPVRRAEVRALLIQLANPASRGTPCLHADKAIPLLEAALRDPSSVPLSHILCTAILGEPKRGDLCAAEFGTEAGNDSDRDGTFNWGWPLASIEPLEPPVPAKGLQGFWNWSAP